jgi:dihydroflavonol-4-reductase
VKALVTGAAGFIGSHVVRALVADGHEVRALHLPGADLRNLRGLDVELVPGDVTDRDSVRAAVHGRDWVFHLAAIYALWARDPGLLRRVNVEGTRVLLEAARDAGVARVVHTSSIARFGGQGLGKRGTEASPYCLGVTGDLYTQTKYEAHLLAESFARELDVTIVAPTGPLGPGDVGPTPTGRLLLSAINLPVAFVVKTATCVGDVRDMARGHVLAAMHGRRGESYLLGNHDVEATDLLRLALALVGLGGKPILVAPLAAARCTARAALLYAERVSHEAPLITPAAVETAAIGLRADCGKAIRELGLPTRPVAHSVLDQLRWFAREGYVKDPAIRGRILDWTGAVTEGPDSLPRLRGRGGVGAAVM